MMFKSCPVRGFLSPRHGASPLVPDGGVGLQIWMLVANILNKQSWTADQEWFSSLGFGLRLTTSQCKNIFVQKHHTGKYSQGYLT